MWKYIKMMYNKVPGSLSSLKYEELPSSLTNCLSSNIYYTPKLQNLPFTQELARYLRYLKRKDKITSKDLRNMVQAMLTEYGVVHGLQTNQKLKSKIEYSISRNYQFKENELSPFYGVVDYMVWLNNKHFVPVLFCQHQLNPVAGIAAAHATRALKCMARNDLRNSGYSIITTGQEWQMFKIYNTQKAEKTPIYEGRNRFRNILDDYEMISTLLGVVDQCLQTQREDVQVLKLAYEVIDEGKHMISAQTQEQAKKASLVGKYLLKYYEKKKEQTSK